MARSNEPMVWSLFSAGGVVAALFGPVLVFVLGVGGALGLLSIDSGLSYEHLRGLVSHPVTRLGLLAVITLTMAHWAHRFRYLMGDLGLKVSMTARFVACYAVFLAVVGFAARVLWSL